MTELNWGDALYEAENSPRIILSEYMEQADELSNIVVIAVKRDAVNRDYFSFRCSGSTFMSLGMVVAAMDDLKSQIADGDS